MQQRFLLYFYVYPAKKKKQPIAQKKSIIELFYFNALWIGRLHQCIFKSTYCIGLRGVHSHFFSKERKSPSGLLGSLKKQMNIYANKTTRNAFFFFDNIVYNIIY